MEHYTEVDFYAELSSARVGASRVGTVLVVSRTIKNGRAFKCIGAPKGDTRSAPVPTWVSPEHLAKRCEKISEAEARALHPRMFDTLVAFDRSPEFRAMLAIEVKAAFPRRMALQPVTERSNDGQGGATLSVRGQHWQGDHFRRIYGA